MPQPQNAEDPKSGGPENAGSEASELGTTVQDSQMPESEEPTQVQESEGPTQEQEEEVPEEQEQNAVLEMSGRPSNDTSQENMSSNPPSPTERVPRKKRTSITSISQMPGQMASRLTQGLTSLAGSMLVESPTIFARKEKGLSRNARTDEESFNQFLDQVIKAHLEEQDGSREAFVKRKKARRNVSGILTGVAGGGLFSRCPRLQACTFNVCARIENSVLFGLLCWVFLIIHCVALVQVANQQGDADTWREVSRCYMAFFLLELLVRICATPNRFFWESGFLVLDLLLVAASLAEALRPLLMDQAGEGQFTFLPLHILRFLRGLQALNMPETGHAVMACFGGIFPFTYFSILCCIWSFLAVVWYLVLSSSQPPVAQFSNFGSSLLTQFYLAARGLDWGRISHPMLQNPHTNVMAVVFVITLVTMSFLTVNATIIFFYEVADNAIQDCQRKASSGQMRRRLVGLSRLEQALEQAASAEGAPEEEWAEWLMSSRRRLAQVLKHLQVHLDGLNISIDETLQLYDHLLEVNDGGYVHVPELLFGILRLVSPSEVAELLQVDHLQKQCIQVTESSITTMEDLIENGGQQLDTIETSVERLRLQLAELRSTASNAREEIRGMMSDVEKQYGECTDSVNQASSIRRLHLQLTHQKARQELHDEVTASQKSLANLQQFSRLCVAFGFPPLGDAESWKDSFEAASFGNARQFEVVGTLLQTEVKDRIQTRLAEYLKAQTLREVSQERS